MSSKHNNNSEPEDKSLTPIVRPQSYSEKLINVVSDNILPKETVPETQRFAALSPEQKEQLDQIEKRALIQFTGMLDELESALGMLRMGHHFGWKVLYLIHSKKTIRKYEEILDIKIRDIFPDEGPSAERSIGLEIAKRFSNFWKVVSGETELTKDQKENRRKIE